MSRKFFGTDGIRGIANVDLKPTLAYSLGRAVAHRLVRTGGSLVVGQDTRRSGDMFVAAITAGSLDPACPSWVITPTTRTPGNRSTASARSTARRWTRWRCSTTSSASSTCR